MEFFKHIIENISIHHLNVLTLMGIALFGGTIGGRIFQKMKIPQVVGYIIVGLILGEMGFKIINKELIDKMEPFSYFALSIISFMVGGELKKEVFLKYGKQFMYILFFEAFTAFFIVGALVTFVTSFFYTFKVSLALGLILGAISAATAAAGTTDVLWEYKTKGPLTTTILGIVALDDALSLILFAIAASLASSLLHPSHESIAMQMIEPMYEIFGSLILGAIFGYINIMVIKKNKSEDWTLAFTLGCVILSIGLATILKLDILLEVMAFGALIANYNPKKSEEVFNLINKFAPPIYVLFFVLFGAKLNIAHLDKLTMILIAVFLFGRTFGKGLGAYLGGLISKAPETVTKYLPLCLLSQSGVAIGLSMFAAQKFSGEGSIGSGIVILITSTTIIVQLVGPSLIKIAVEKAGEVGKNITEDDFIKQSKAKDVMEDVPKIPINMKAHDILKIFSEYDVYYYPVVDENDELKGVITIDNLKTALLNPETYDFLIAEDLMTPVSFKINENTPLVEVKETIKNNNLDFVVIVDDSGKFKGIIETGKLDKFISRKIIELRKAAEA